MVQDKITTSNERMPKTMMCITSHFNLVFHLNFVYSSNMIYNRQNEIRFRASMKKSSKISPISGDGRRWQKRGFGLERAHGRERGVAAGEESLRNGRTNLRGRGSVAVGEISWSPLGSTS